MNGKFKHEYIIIGPHRREPAPDHIRSSSLLSGNFLTTWQGCPYTWPVIARLRKADQRADQSDPFKHINNGPRSLEIKRAVLPRGPNQILGIGDIVGMNERG